MLEPLELPAGVTRPDVANRLLQPARSGPAEAEDSNDEGDDDDAFLPNAGGYCVTLADGTATRLRFRKAVEEASAAPLWLPELRTANRDIPVPPNQDLPSLARRVLTYFKEPHKEVEWSPKARLLFKGFQAVFDAQAAKARDSDAAGGVGEAARLGVAPWHLGMLSVALLIVEIAVGDEPASARGHERAAGSHSAAGEARGGPQVHLASAER